VYFGFSGSFFGGGFGEPVLVGVPQSEQNFSFSSNAFPQFVQNAILV
jgi:hypothetical protein